MIEKVIENHPHLQLISPNILTVSDLELRYDTEMVLLMLVDYLLLAIDNGQIFIVILMTLSDAFNTVDHERLVACLEDLARMRCLNN